MSADTSRSAVEARIKLLREDYAADGAGFDADLIEALLSERDDANHRCEAAQKALIQWMKERPVAPHPKDQLSKLKAALYDSAEKECSELRAERAILAAKLAKAKSVLRDAREFVYAAKHQVEPAPGTVDRMLDDIADVLLRLTAEPAKGVRRVRHRKRGSTYTVVGYAALQTSEPLEDMRGVVVYRADADGRLWVRPCTEFDDGRFEELTADPAKGGEG